MMRAQLRIVAGGTLLLAAALSAAQSTQYRIGVSAGVYFPTDVDVRDAFGDTLLGFGISPVSYDKSDRWRPTWDIGLVAANKNGNKFVVVPVTYGLEKAFGNEDAKTRPYVRFGVGAAYSDYSITRGLTRYSTKRLGPCGLAEAGLILDQSFRVSARLNVFDERDGFNFTGLELTATYRF